MANIKFTGLPSASSIDDTDILALSQDLATTPVSRKATTAQLKSYIIASVAGPEVIPITSDGQTAFTLSNTPAVPSASQLYVRGQMRRYITDFTISGNTLTWNNADGVTLKTTDDMRIWYDLNITGIPVLSVFGRTGAVTATVNDYDASEVNNDSSVSGANVALALDALLAAIPTVPTTREIFIAGTDYNANLGNIRVRSIAGTGAYRFTFGVPSDFSSIISAELIGAVSAGAAGSGKDIDLSSDYGAVGEATNIHSETDTTTTYDFTGKSGQYVAISLNGILTSLAANDNVGILVDHNGIGGAINYIGIRFKYNL